MRRTPEELQQSINGLLGFPLTPFTPDNRLDLAALRQQVRLLLEHGIGGIFPACGTGEFFSLTAGEYRDVIKACAEEVAGAVPVIAGVGYGTAMACEFAEFAEQAGADGLLAMPPYLITPEQLGLEAHYRAIAGATKLGLIIYQRDNAVFEPETVFRLAAVPNVIGLKDGLGQLERLQLIRDRVGEPFLYLNGMPTAEVHALAYAAHGVTTYSSALLNFLPEVATRFHAAVAQGEGAVINTLLRDVIWPLTRIRNRRPGYAVALIKAGARLRGLSVGSVRPPLVDMTEADQQDLAALMSALRLDGVLA